MSFFSLINPFIMLIIHYVPIQLYHIFFFYLLHFIKNHVIQNLYVGSFHP